MLKTYKTQAIVLKRINFSETDRIITLFTKHYGKISVLAKGVRRITSRRSGSVELFNNLTVFIHRGKSLDLLTEVELLDSYKEIKSNFKKVGCAYYFAELVDKLTPQEQENRQVYELLKTFLKKLESARLEELTFSFEKNLLGILGFGVPDEIKDDPEAMTFYIESIAERKINSKNIK